MVDWPEDSPPPTPQQAALAKALWEQLTEEEVRLATRGRLSSVPSQEDYYRLQRDLLRANRQWRRALRLHWWRVRYLLRRAWTRLTQPWADERRIRHTREYMQYLTALREKEDGDAPTRHGKV